jgi:hypothetical protein
MWNTTFEPTDNPTSTAGSCVTSSTASQQACATSGMLSPGEAVGERP